ncbi:hypothetical protein SOCEGT47_080560 [Sorangium cellulosum]|uniref:Secreted protein n=1 Tax=Sorangium cellulosum TaxID=56 RepID=A0A4P2QCK7_SORCE|nr:beta-propeller domain-containing protein [Sorangium cellulosum]AUX27465.1 hypothetical protein SOCEGT47_080560 [Sorangium cellulosum]
MRTQRFSSLWLIAATGLLAAGCDTGSTATGTHSAPLRRAQSCEDLEASLKQDALAKMNAQIDAMIASYHMAYFGPAIGADQNGPVAVPGEPAVTPAPTPPGAPGAGGDAGAEAGGHAPQTAGGAANDSAAPAHSDTNTQVAGVDEADIVKTDGNHIYLLHGEKFYTLTAWPASSLAVGSSLAIEGDPREMFVAGDKVVVYSSVNGAQIYERAGVEPRPEFYDYGFGGGIGRPVDTVPGTVDPAVPVDAGGSDPLPPPDAEPPSGGDTPSSDAEPPSGGDAPSSDPVPPSDGGGTNGSAGADEDIAPTGGAYAPLTKITVLSLASGAPSVVKELYFEGWYASARRDGQHVRTVLTGGAHGPALRYWPEAMTESPSSAEAWRAAFEQLRAENTAIIEGAPVSTWLPYRFEERGDAVALLEARCSDFYVPEAGTTSYGLTQIEAIDLDHLDREPASTSVIGATDTVYASHDALYVAARGWQEPLSRADLGDEPVILDATHLHKFDLTADPSQPRYVASGSVPGHLLNQFSLDEHDGRLRIATTAQLASATAWTTANNVFVLEERGAALARVGAVLDLAPGEQIRSARFVGDRGYLVTFRQVDPLFVLDLADPAAPAVTGELKIPGFSEYMHPMDDGHLLTIGRDGTDDGRVTGVALQVFDVTDPTAPALLHKETLEAPNAHSPAEHDHKAFTYDGERGLLAFPLVSSARDTGAMESALQLYHVDLDDGFRWLGAVDHSAFFDATPDDWGCYAYLPEVRRGLFIEDHVYSISLGGVIASSLDDLATPVASLPLPAPVTPWSACGGVAEPVPDPGVEAQPDPGVEPQPEPGVEP